MSRDVYAELAEKNIASLHIKCTRGIYAERLFRTVARGLDKFYPLEKLEWMKGFLDNADEHIAAGCLECLCAHGYSLDENSEVFQKRVDDKWFSLKVIDLAEKYDKPRVLVHYMDEEKGYVNRVIVALKRMHRETYMMSFLMSTNIDLAKSVHRIVHK